MLGDWELGKVKLEQDVVTLEHFGEGLPQFFILSFELGNAPELCGLHNLQILDVDCNFLIAACVLSIITSAVGIMKFLLIGPFPVYNISKIIHSISTFASCSSWDAVRLGGKTRGIRI
jgi:hypothetical protein